MDSHPRKSNTAFEYFLYAAILAETGLAALVYKFIFQTTDLAHLRIYFAIFYFAFLAWAIAQLNRLHRNHRQMELDSTPVELPSSEPARALLGLNAAQSITVLIVFAAAVAAFSWALRALN